MKDFIGFDEYDFNANNFEKVLVYATRFLQGNFNSHAHLVLTTAFKDPRNLPTIQGHKGRIQLEPYVLAWSNKYLSGYNNRPSIRHGNPQSTYPDPIIKIFLESRLPTLNQELLEKVIGGHQLLMTIENLVGDILEEYLSVMLHSDGWSCCWGSTVDAVDFIHTDGRLLQVKNSSNSENSSSSRVRSGTAIAKWFRRVASRQDSFHWSKIQLITGRSDLTEESFREFAINIIRKNPACIYIPDNNPLS